jgi:hypothetical protein
MPRSVCSEGDSLNLAVPFWAATRAQASWTCEGSLRIIRVVLHIHHLSVRL